jgi:hypothetical protein
MIRNNFMRDIDENKKKKIPFSQLADNLYAKRSRGFEDPRLGVHEYFAFS